MDRDGVGLSDEERDLLEPCSRPAETRWVRPLASFERKVTYEGGGARYG
jgi:hypothetical protein